MIFTFTKAWSQYKLWRQKYKQGMQRRVHKVHSLLVFILCHATQGLTNPRVSQSFHKSMLWLGGTSFITSHDWWDEIGSALWDITIPYRANTENLQPLKVLDLLCQVQSMGKKFSNGSNEWATSFARLRRQVDLTHPNVEPIAVEELVEFRCS